MYKVISFKICPFFQYVVAMLEAKQLLHQVEYSDFDQCKFDLSPNGKAPILVAENQQVLFDADAIVSYLERRYPDGNNALTDEQKSQQQAWANYASKHYVTQCSAMRSDSEQAFNEHMAVLTKAFENMEKQADMLRRVKQTHPDIVDVAWVTLLHRAHIVRQYTGVDMLQGLPMMQAWQRRLLASGLAAASVSADFEQVFVDFYLTNGYLANIRSHKESA